MMSNKRIRASLIATGILAVWMLPAASYAQHSAAPLASQGSSLRTKAHKESQAAGKNLLPSKFIKDLIYVKVSLNGAAAAWMELDTGTAGSSSIVDLDYAKSIGLKLTPASEGTGGFGAEKIATFKTSTVHLRAGNGSREIISFESFKLGGMSGPDGHQLAGLLGYNFLVGKTLVIDYKNEEVYFAEGSSAMDSRDMPMKLASGGVPIIQTSISGHTVDTLIDSGGTYGLLITPPTAKEAGIESFMDEAKPLMSSGHGGEQVAKLGKAPDFSIGGVVMHDVSTVYSSFGTTGLGAGASLGKDFLKNYKITLNYGAGTARFEQ